MRVDGATDIVSTVYDLYVMYTSFGYIQFAKGATLKPSTVGNKTYLERTVYASYRLSVRPFYNQESCMDVCVYTVLDGLFELL